MKIELKFFASVREALGVTSESAAVPDGIATVGDVRAWLCTRGDAALVRWGLRSGNPARAGLRTAASRAARLDST